MLILATRIAIASAATIAATLGVTHRETHPDTLHVTIAATGQQIIGTTYIETDTVTRDAQPFGLAVLTCPGAAQANVHIAHCTVDFGLENGTLHAKITNNNDTGSVAGTLTGGTGTYARASGHITGTGTDNGATLTIIINSRH